MEQNRGLDFSFGQLTRSTDFIAWYITWLWILLMDILLLCLSCDVRRATCDVKLHARGVRLLCWMYLFRLSA